MSERGAVCPIRNKFDPAFNIWAGCSGLTQFSELMANHSKYYDVIIMDRGFFDAICWFQWQKNLRKLKERHFDRFVNFFLSPRWISKVSILYIFSALPNVSLQREHATLLTSKPGSIMNAEVLKDFNEAMNQCVRQYRVHFGDKIRSIDTSSKNQDEVSYQVTKEILETLRAMIVEKIGYFSRDVLQGVTDEVFDPDVVFSRVRQLNYGIRTDVESDNQSVQPIPVALVTDSDVRRVVIAKKLQSAVSSMSPERRRDLIYFGGHIREEDELSESEPGSVADVAGTALTRELKEELDIDFDATDERPIFCIWDRSNEQSARHVALVYHVKVDRQSLRVSTDRKEFAEKGARIIDIGDLGARDDNFESWSHTILSSLLSK